MANPCAKFRDIQKACKLSSVSQVSHHLKMLNLENYRQRADQDLIDENIELRKRIKELETKLARIARDLAKHI